MNPLDSDPLPKPAGPGPLPPEVVVGGQPIEPIKRIRLFDPGDWEDFVLEWAHSLQSKYARVERCGGSGDMGRDVLGFHLADSSKWDNFQCKHYDHPLAPSDIWTEIGKLVFYSMEGHYTVPEKYYFVAPQGAGTKLSNLIRNPNELKEDLLQDWDRHCRTRISSTRDIPLDHALRRYIDTIDFSIFDSVPPLELIDQHSKTRWHVARFGGGLPPRPPHEPPPSIPAPNESTFIRQLLDAYADHMGSDISTPSALSSSPHLLDHFDLSRVEFYSAEALRAFSRDTLPPGEFESLQDEFSHGVADQVAADHPDGFARVQAVLGRARILPIDAHSLAPRVGQKDRGGICHQLANDNRVTWVP